MSDPHWHQVAFNQLAGRRLIADVQLVKALGGGWNNSAVATLAIASVKR